MNPIAPATGSFTTYVILYKHNLGSFRYLRRQPKEAARMLFLHGGLS